MNILSMPFSALTWDERKWLRDAARETEGEFGPGSVMVNIGVEHGCSLHCLRAGAPTAAIYGIDIDNSLLIGEPGVHLITGDSNDICQAFGKFVHLLFVDGGHDYETVWGDLEGWSPLVVSGGLMVLHDYYDVHGGRAPWIEGVGVAGQEWAARACWDGGGWTAMEKVDSIQAYRKGEAIGSVP
jgi:hypothetical protein